MGILDGIVDWLATQVMNLLDLASTSVLGALGCNMDTFKRYFPAASSMYEIFIWTAIGLVLLNLVWQLYRCYGAGFDIDTENPINLVVRSVIFLLLIWYCDDIVNLALQIGGTPYTWILDSSLPGVQFGDFNSVLLIIIGVIANGSVALIALILVVILAWNYLKLLLEAAERYVVLGILVFTAPLAADDTIYHAVSATILYLTAQSKIQPLVYQSGIPYYSQEVFEKVLLEMFGQHLDCTGLLQPVQIETHEEEAIPIKYPLAGAAYRVTLLSQQDSSSLYAGTPESAAAPSSEATVSLTYYLPSSAQVGEILFMPGERPYRISVQSNVSWEYLPFCFLGIEQET